MATKGTPIPAFTVARLLRLRAAGLSVRRCARELGVSPATVQKYAPTQAPRAA